MNKLCVQTIKFLLFFPVVVLFVLQVIPAGGESAYIAFLAVMSVTALCLPLLLFNKKKRWNPATVPHAIAALILLVGGVLKLIFMYQAVSADMSTAVMMLGHSYATIHLPFLQSATFEAAMELLMVASVFLCLAWMTPRSMSSFGAKKIFVVPMQARRMLLAGCVVGIVSFAIKLAFGLGLSGRVENLPYKLEAIALILNVYLAPLLLLMSLTCSIYDPACKSRLPFWTAIFLYFFVNYLFFGSKLSLVQPAFWFFLLCLFEPKIFVLKRWHVLIFVVAIIVAYPFLNIYRSFLHAADRDVGSVLGEFANIVESGASYASDTGGSAPLISLLQLALLQMMGRVNGADSQLLVMDWISTRGHEGFMNVAFGERSLNQIFTEDIFWLPYTPDGSFAPSLLGGAYLATGSVLFASAYLIVLVELVSWACRILLSRRSVGLPIAVFLSAHFIGIFTDGGNAKQIALIVISVVLAVGIFYSLNNCIKRRFEYGPS